MAPGAPRLYDDLPEKKPYHDGTIRRWSEVRGWDFRFHYLDGVTIWLSPVELDPNDDFLGRSVLGESPGNPGDPGEGQQDRRQLEALGDLFPRGRNP